MTDLSNGARRHGKRAKSYADDMSMTAPRNDAKGSGGLKNIKGFFVGRKQKRGAVKDVSADVGNAIDARDNASQKVRPRKKRPNRLSVFIKRLGYVRLIVKGREGVRALTAIGKFAPISDVAFSPEGVTFSAPAKLCGKILAILDNLCYDYKIIKYSGVAPALVRTSTRFGLILGLALVVVAVALYPSLITRIRLEGELDGVLNDRIYGILSEYGVEEGKMLFGIDADGIEKRILALDGVSYVGVIRSGTHVTVTVKREEPHESYVDIKGSKVVATELATVTRVIVNGGTAAVSYGDVVKPGDALIEGYVLYGDSRVDVEAKGVVYGKVYRRKTVYFADEPLIREYGEVKKVTKLSLFGKVPKPPTSPFEAYELSVSVSELGFLIPLKAYVYEFRQIVERKAVNELDEEGMKAVVYSQLISELEGACRTLDAYYDVTRTDEGTYVTATLEVEKAISDYADI